MTLNAETRKLRVLFLCTGNACRSQMAEGWARHVKGHLIEAYSAGTDPHGMDRRVVQVMAECGVDLSGHTSKHVDELADIPFDLVVTVCDRAHESCPIFPDSTRIMHQGFDDPPRLAAEATSEEEILNCYRQVRDDIRTFIEALPMTNEPTVPQ